MTRGPLEQCASLLAGVALSNEPLGPRTTYRVGGPAALFVVVDSEDVLARVAAAVATSGVEVLVVGNGSNMLVADAGFPGLALQLGGEFASITVDASGCVVAGGATPYPVLARTTAAKGFAGLEWAVGIPGTTGGGVRMNAGGHGATTSERLVAASVLDLSSGDLHDRPVAALACGYRTTSVSAHEIVVSARFATDRGDRAASLAKIDEIVRWRREHQPGGRNCGSVFTNPLTSSAGALIEEAGMKEVRVGGAHVSMKHANFIQADPGATAEDVRRLVEVVRAAVAARMGVELATELRFVGFASA